MKSQTKSITLTLASLAVATVFALTVPNTYAQFTTQTNSQNNNAEAGTVGVQLVDANGNQSSSPVFSIANAQPAMGAQTSTIRIANTGTLAADIRLYVTNLEASANSLDDVLKIAIKDADNNSLYSGSISELDINFTNLPASTTKELTAIVTWPDLISVDDNPYQGATLNFEFAVDSAAISA